MKGLHILAACFLLLLAVASVSGAAADLEGEHHVTRDLDQDLDIVKRGWIRKKWRRIKPRLRKGKKVYGKYKRAKTAYQLGKLVIAYFGR
ncbi:hypothetical protein ElyMa_002886000 [Elysia marginata]|uniref:Uncharacterized protein n=1 Tax=Elysia marginata TaxID=1093978 RepID=A0AAV4I400_9GAST|nr:hypothetical protein ElyMa_002886000 [Elysia marginata]